MAKIICPYCFRPFHDHEVHFRAETVFTPAQAASSANNIDQYFKMGENQRHKLFWERYGGATESDDSTPWNPPYHRPVIPPSNGPGLALLRDRDQFVCGALDYYGRETKRRVCPHCCNPLPQNYGKYPVMFFSVAGVPGAGKTIFLSQFCSHIDMIALEAGFTLEFEDREVKAFVRRNPIAENKSLPAQTFRRSEGALNQPLIFHFSATGKPPAAKFTMVVYDLGGEICIDADMAGLYAPFLRHSHALFLLVDPNQFADDGGRALTPHTCLDVVLQALPQGETPLDIPLAVCLTKADNRIGGLGLPELSEKTVGSGQQFHADHHREVSQQIEQFVKRRSPPLYHKLFQRFYHYNYFYLSALGVNTKQTTGEGRVPVSPPNPVRMEEPFGWILYKLGLGKCYGTERRPDHQWRLRCPKCRALSPCDIEAKAAMCPKCGRKVRLHGGESDCIV